MSVSATDPRAGWSQLPLPGTHKCVTWQLNVTIHPPQRGVKFVSIIRDPDEQVELARVGTMLIEDLRGLEMLLEHVGAAIAQLHYLAGLPGPR